MGRKPGSRTVTLDLRVTGVALVSSGLPPARAAMLLGVQPPTVRRWVRRWRVEGMEGLRSQRPKGRPPRLGEQELVEELRRIVMERALRDWRAPPLREIAREVSLGGRPPYDVDHLARRLRRTLAPRDNLLPARVGLKSFRYPTRVVPPTGPSTNDREELASAIRAKDRERVRRLLETDHRLATARNDVGLSPLMIALYAGANDVASDLAQCMTPDLFEATALGDVPQVERLLTGEPSLVHAHSPDGWTALHLAAHFGHPRVANSSWPTAPG